MGRSSDALDELVVAAVAVDGEPLDALSAALVRLGVASAVTQLDRDGTQSAIDAALAAGATTAQLEQILALVSGLGVHTLMLAVPLVRRTIDDAPLDRERQALWAKHVGDDRYWGGFESEFPGFLDSLLRVSPDLFRAFFDYCGVPWKTDAVPARTKELVALATDATPTHVFLPGFRLHLRNAVKLGAGRRAIFDALAIANPTRNREHA